MEKRTAHFAQGTKFAKEKILESREKAAFQKHCPFTRNHRQTAVRRRAFCLPHLSSGRQKSLLGDLCAL